jgi:hypothetical protein
VSNAYQTKGGDNGGVSASGVIGGTPPPTTTIATLSLPAGTYLVSGKVVTQASVTGASDVVQFSCYLEGPSFSRIDRSASSTTGFSTIPLLGSASLATSSTVSMKCDVSGGGVGGDQFSGWFYNWRLTAIQVSNLN